MSEEEEARQDKNKNIISKPRKTMQMQKIIIYNSQKQINTT
jgi:hypothetical protein